MSSSGIAYAVHTIPEACATLFLKDGNIQSEIHPDLMSFIHNNSSGVGEVWLYSAEKLEKFINLSSFIAGKLQKIPIFQFVQLQRAAISSAPAVRNRLI